MHFGSAVHSHLENFYSRSNATVEYTPPDDIPQYSHRALEFLIEKYKEKYSDDLNSFEILEAEKVSTIEIGDHTFLVKKDGAFKVNGNIFGLEHKTTKSIAYNYFDKYFLNSQISAQCFSTNQDYKQCSGIMLNAIEIKLLKRKPTSKGYDGYFEVEDGFVTVRFNRDYINRTQLELLQWKENASLWIDRVEESKKTNVWGRSDGLWGGMICSKCQYKELCKVSKGMELDESVVDCLYETIDPYEYLKEGENVLV